MVITLEDIVRDYMEKGYTLCEIKNEVNIVFNKIYDEVRRPNQLKMGQIKIGPDPAYDDGTNQGEHG